MEDISAIKRRVCDEIEKRKDKIIEIGNDIFMHPELGYKEYRTSELVGKVFSEMGLAFEDGLAITGKKAKMPGRSSKMNVCIMGELDSVQMCIRDRYFTVLGCIERRSAVFLTEEFV